MDTLDKKLADAYNAVTVLTRENAEKLETIMREQTNYTLKVLAYESGKIKFVNKFAFDELKLRGGI
jgi:hypothetical protein